MREVEHDGSEKQYYNKTNDHPDIVSVTLAPDTTSIGKSALSYTSIFNLRSLKDSTLTKIEPCAFVRCNNLTDLSGLPPQLLVVAYAAFAGCDRLESLRGLPLTTVVDNKAFGGDRSNFCKLLFAKALFLGFTGSLPINEWVLDRKQIPSRRYAILSCVRQSRWCTAVSNDEVPLDDYTAKLARAFSNVSPPTDPALPLLGKIAALPDVLIREIVLYAHSDHILTDFRPRARGGGRFSGDIRFARRKISITR
jgi:hypothetical protein